MSATDILIAGAGIIGLSAALEFAQRGFNVTVLEQGQAMREASWAAAGMLAAHDPENPPGLRAMADLSLAAYPAFLRTVEQLSGCRVAFRTATTLQATRRALAGAEDSDGCEISRLVPELVAGAYRFKVLDEESLDPRDLCHALPLAARAAGVTLRERCMVFGVEREGEKLRVRTNRGEYQAKSYAHCCGAWSAAFVPGEGPLPVEPRKGQMVAVRMPPGGPALACVLRTPELYLVPRGDGRIVVGATVERTGFDRAIKSKATDALLSAAAELWPPIGDGVVVEEWAGLRPGTPDGLPILDAPIAGFYVATGHFRNGILLAPGTAQLLRQMVLGEPPAIDVAPFALGRFSVVAR